MLARTRLLASLVLTSALSSTLMCACGGDSGSLGTSADAGSIGGNFFPTEGRDAGTGGGTDVSWSGPTPGYDAGAIGSAPPPSGPGRPVTGVPDGGAPPPQPDGGASCEGLDKTQPVVRYLSADDSNSMASPAIARRLINSRQPVPPWLIRTYEFLNYYRIAYPAAEPGSVAIFSELRPAKDAGKYQLQIAVSSERAAMPRKPMNLTFVLDTSGSMQGAPIELLRTAVRTIAANLRAGDLVSMVTWNTGQFVALDSYAVTGPNDSALLAAVARLNADGGTDLDGGLVKGYQLAQANFAVDRLNRVILISDGMANVGVTNETLIGMQADQNDGEGIYLVGIGVGDGINDTLMDTVTDAGRGAYVYLDSADEAQAILGGRFDEVMDVAARAVEVRVKLPWYMQIKQFSGEMMSSVRSDVKPQHLAPNDAMVFNQVLDTCAADAVMLADPIDVSVQWQTPITHEIRTLSAHSTFGDLLNAPADFLAKGTAIVAYANALKATTDQITALQNAKDLVTQANPAGTDPELNEIAPLIDLYLQFLR